MKPPVVEKRFCGNCGSHNSYDYPNRVFCGRRLEAGKDPVVQTLWCCTDWNSSSQECYCVKEATRQKNSRPDSPV